MWQILPKLTSNCELTKLQDENNALKQRLRDVEDRSTTTKREAKSIQDENKSLMTALKLLNNETERQIAVGRKMSARNSTDIVSQTINNERTTVIVGDSITKNVQGIKLAKTVGHRVVVKPFPGATIRDMPGASNVNFRKISVEKTI